MTKKYPIIFIAGLGGSGKTTLANQLSKRLKCEAQIVSDWYLTYPTEERKIIIKKALASKNKELIEKEENPFNWNDFKQFKKDLLYLQKKGKVNIKSAWNQKTGLKDLDLKIEFKKESGLIICDGIYLLHDDVAKLADLIICLKTRENEANKRTAQRDSHRSSKEYLNYKAKLQSKYDVPYFKKYLKNADMIIDTNKDSYLEDVTKGLLKIIKI